MRQVSCQIRPNFQPFPLHQGPGQPASCSRGQWWSGVSRKGLETGLSATHATYEAGTPRLASRGRACTHNSRARRRYHPSVVHAGRPTRKRGPTAWPHGALSVSAFRRQDRSLRQPRRSGVGTRGGAGNGCAGPGRVPGGPAGSGSCWYAVRLPHAAAARAWHSLSAPGRRCARPHLASVPALSLWSVAPSASTSAPGTQVGSHCGLPAPAIGSPARPGNREKSLKFTHFRASRPAHSRRHDGR